MYKVFLCLILYWYQNKVFRAIFDIASVLSPSFDPRFCCVWTVSIRVVGVDHLIAFLEWTKLLLQISSPTSESSLFRCFCYSDVLYSDPHCIVKLMIIWKLDIPGINIVTVQRKTKIPLFEVFSLVHFVNNPAYVYSGDLKSVLLWILNGQKEVELQMVCILNGICNPEAQQFEIRTTGSQFVKNNLKSGHKCPDLNPVRILL